VIQALALFVAAAPSTVDMVFLPDAADAPSLVVSIGNVGPRRAVSWALVAPPGGPGTTMAGDHRDQGDAPGLLSLPRAPRGAGLVEKDGAISAAVDDAGAWEDAWHSLAPSGAGPLPIAGPRAFRLVIHGTVDGGPAQAILYGNKVRIPGTATARAERSELRAVVAFAGAGRGQSAMFLDAPATAVDRIAGCGGEVPSAVTVVTTSQVLKLFAKGAPACAGDLAVIPVAGTTLHRRREVDVRGVVVRRQPWTPSGSQ
jgi:hypothetical protein